MAALVYDKFFIFIFLFFFDFTFIFDLVFIFSQGRLNKKEIQLNFRKIFSILIFYELYLFA